MSQHTVFIGVPVYDQLAPQALKGLMLATERHRNTIYTEGGSLLALMFNMLWCRALNARQQGFTHFAMMHADIEAPAGWLDALLEEMDEYGADVLSCVVPIKDNRGLTSTGYQDPQSKKIRRLTVRECLRLPKTFHAGNLVQIGKPANQHLMVNTGLWACRITEPWAEEVCFTVRDAIGKLADGSFWPRCMPEDWGFSMFAAQKDLKVYVTRRVPVIHHGRAGYSNAKEWGEWQTDQGDYEGTLSPVSA